MKYLQLQVDILKTADKRERNQKCTHDFQYGMMDESICVIVDAHYIVIVPDAVWYLDNSKVFTRPPMNMENMIRLDDQYEIYDSGLTRSHPDGRELKMLSGSFKTYIDKANLKYFDKDITHYTARDNKSPVHVYSDNYLIGLVMPVRIE